MANYSDTGLGKQSTYTDQYDVSLLQPISRSKARQHEAGGELPFVGSDLWTAFELSWLNSDGLPQVAIGEFSFPCTSDSIIESKSFKLYLNSLIQTKYPSKQAVTDLLTVDLSDACGKNVGVVLYELSEYSGFHRISEPDGICLDHRGVSIDTYEPDNKFLIADKREVITETLYSHLLKTNCPVTDQPDWASVYVSYSGPRIDKDGLLKYVVSYRQHQDFHEQCVEQIFTDIMQCCSPSELSVYARYMRRGGLDINPFRSTTLTVPPVWRQVRQ
ncbi:MAG: NADPH-dependent 7-cyano-7-deazaguanine reductase QueF [Porticoccaceae bacterium]|nr:NADPH-dependent 7-cyano-7-deazaguanine reductase QueF [Porticoccaceae bacterium]